ncbi:DUF2029 domain-containing protein [Cryobacterium sp. TmT2-59]|nr:DUF2029 domain-containing protein [Cryobacterium sp. TmT2-59]TFD28496.1 DUF2029 domain-containing protein [Cryobacterium sp. TMT2-23]
MINRIRGKSPIKTPIQPKINATVVLVRPPSFPPSPPPARGSLTNSTEILPESATNSPQSPFYGKISVELVRRRTPRSGLGGVGQWRVPESTPGPTAAAATDATAHPRGWVRPALLWAGFAAVHAALAWLCFASTGWPLGDVERSYLGWATDAVTGGGVVGISAPFVYPILAILPMLAALAFGPGLYSLTWLGLVTLLDAVAFAVLLGPGRDPRARLAAAWWLGFLLLLGPIAVGRIDAITVPLAILAVLVLRSRPVWGTMLLTLAAWIKIWPAAVIAALFLVSRKRWPVAAAAAGTSLGIVVIALFLGSGLNVFSFVSEQTNRGIQIESPVAGLWMWQAALKTPGNYIYYDQQILTYQVIGTGTQVAIAVMTPLLLACIAAVLLLGWQANEAGASWPRLFPPLVLALVLTLILVNKVGSPQFTAWLAAPVILGLVLRGRAWRLPAVLALAVAALTQLVYPHLYDWLIVADPLLVLVLSLRNLLEVILLGWAVREVHASGARSEHPEHDLVPPTPNLKE